jgi:hypothetical protein
MNLESEEAVRKDPSTRDLSPPPRLRHYALAFVRVVRARWLWRRQGFQLHFRRIVGDAPGVILSPPCGAAPAVGNETTQSGGVGCYRCALFIEADVERWAPKRKQQWDHDPVSGLTCCRGCGGIDGYPPGCRCPDGVAPAQPTVKP